MRAPVAELASGARLLGERLACQAPRDVAERACELQPVVGRLTAALARLEPKAATPATAAAATPATAAAAATRAVAAAAARAAAAAALGRMRGTRHAARRAPRHAHQSDEAVLAVAADHCGEGLAAHDGVGPDELRVLVLPREARRAARTPALPADGRRADAHPLHLS